MTRIYKILFIADVTYMSKYMPAGTSGAAVTAGVVGETTVLPLLTAAKQQQ